jgi:predicted nucleic acid-binding protein
VGEASPARAGNPARFELGAGSMTVGVVDSTIIVHLFRKNPSALTWYASLAQPLAITPITWMEIMYGAAGKAGQAKCKAILNEFDMEYLTRTDMD